jgi:hypothetical protein
VATATEGESLDQAINQQIAKLFCKGGKNSAIVPRFVSLSAPLKTAMIPASAIAEVIYAGRRKVGGETARRRLSCL